jgi:hypothetical protein
MNFKKEFMITLETKEGNFNFFGIIHRTSKSTDLKMNPENFYKKFGGKIPNGIHHEIQWTALPLLCKNVKKGLIHIHEENFVCWTQQIPTEEKCLEVIKVAALGILYGTKTGKDFADIFKECKESMEETIKKLSELCDLKYEAIVNFDEQTINALSRHCILAEKNFFL